jgi:hypothetical protein
VGDASTKALSNYLKEAAMFIPSCHPRLMLVLGCLVVAAIQGSGSAIAREPSKEVVGVAIVRMNELPKSLMKDSQGKDVLTVDVKTDPDGGWTQEFTIVHWFRQPWNTDYQLKSPEERPSLKSLKVHFVAREGVPLPSLAAAQYKDRNFVLEIRLVENELVAGELWPLPTLENASKE